MTQPADPYVPTVSPDSNSSVGTEIYYGDATTTAAPDTKLGQIKKIPALPGKDGGAPTNTTRINQTKVVGTDTVIDASTHKSPNPRFSLSNLKVTLGYNSEDYDLCNDPAELYKVKKAWRIVHANKDEQSFIGFINTVSSTHDDGGETVFDVDIEIDGEIFNLPFEATP